ncbi:winged helix-turn-helix transcriptional regulator [Haloarcula nitratireducens]|uniref:Winged helix-turn-helix domain-containing protein n=1 Tax=Haloarcula nitratireducens TaxID=2487749 RepID=A0AAW4PHG6_9EURY|nr:winged helix-turn-helix transcriptional regulator [Halomicroarcula nitratireducens]MBX0296890.1 winged helix-turn-helix domain-containing protein [Halomicroarcula nitratireducens]
MEQKSNPPDGQSMSVAELPPSSKLVFKILQYEGELTQKQIAEKAILSPRTVRSAVTRLEEADEIVSWTKCGDARKKIYTITNETQEKTADAYPFPQ